jgi:hypothetical protein
MLYRLEISAAKFQERAGVQVGVPNAPLPTQEMALEVCFIFYEQQLEISFRDGDKRTFKPSSALLIE